MNAASIQLAPAPPTSTPASSAARGPLSAHAGAGSFASVLQETRAAAPAEKAAAPAEEVAGTTTLTKQDAVSEATFDLRADLGVDQPEDQTTARTGWPVDPSADPAATAPAVAPQQPSALAPTIGFTLSMMLSADGLIPTDAAAPEAEITEDAAPAAGVAEAVSPAGFPTAETAAPGTALGGPAAIPSVPPTVVPSTAAVPIVAPPAAAVPPAGVAPASAAAGPARAVVAGDPLSSAVAESPADSAPPTTLLVPLGTPSSMAAAAPATTVATAAAVPTPTVPLTSQVSRPLFTLMGAANGDHVLTISVSPDNLGPVTVRAHVRGENIRLELFAPTELARDALRAILPELRRDLSGGGMNAQLNLSADNHASDPSAGRQHQADARNDREAGESRTGASGPDSRLASLPSLRAAGSYTIDVFA